MSTWAGTWETRPRQIWYSEHNWRDVTGRRMRVTHVRFTGKDGAEWYGRKVGDHQILRCRRVKGGAR